MLSNLLFLNYEFMNCHHVDSKPGTQGLSPSAMLGFAIFSAGGGNRTQVFTISRREMYGNAIFTAFTKQSFLTLTGPLICVVQTYVALKNCAFFNR